MIATKHLFLAAGLASLALLTAVSKTLHREKHVAKKLHKTELSTWEGEGGNLPPKTSTKAENKDTGAV
ncbi:hypothetical protein H8L32_22360 [Undibacterium sp. CY18W]|uniref:Uncharacterized protein n=1 Tax=Undibacterium hunanense TaxID=2762292 RepID=A0ABR6ZWH8_9BURK|nr:hypothetical protein [Undibacterium hunanense]MBC3920224.1 hypothetical protein [Undibacterium hunanense]